MDQNVRRRILIATGTRADWGLLAPLAQELASRSAVELGILATNMHLERRYGYTIDEVRRDVSARLYKLRIVGGRETGAVGTAYSMGRALSGAAKIIADARPDIVVILGDRFEMLAIASAAAVMRVPVAHISGGDITSGAIDDSMRHAVTKLASLHFTSTESARRRVIQMGEQPSRVFNVGALGVYNALHTRLMSRVELDIHLINLPGGRRLMNETLLVTYHPATLDERPVEERVEALLAALEQFPGNPLLITYPNNDPGSDAIIAAMQAYRDAQPWRVTLVPSLGRRGYLSALQYVKAVVGNSSSGIIEVPSMHIPTVDIGCRQRGRLAAESVLHCADEADSIVWAIDTALSGDFRVKALRAPNPYEQPNTPMVIADTLCHTPLEGLDAKQFYDLPTP